MATHIPESLLNDSMEVDNIITRGSSSTAIHSNITEIPSSMLQNVMEHDVVAFSTTSSVSSSQLLQAAPNNSVDEYNQLQGGGLAGYSTGLTPAATPHPSSTVETLGIDSASTHSLRFEYPLDDHDTPTKTKVKKAPPTVYREQDRFVPINNTGRVMRNAVPKNAKISKDAKQCMQECISEFISFLTSEASDRCIDEKKKTITGDDILFALSTLGFDNYVEPLHMYLKKYREFIRNDKPDRDDAEGCHGNEDDQHLVMTTTQQSADSTSHQIQGDHQLGMNTHALHMLVDQLPSTSNTTLNPAIN